jgi:hypothetical protein
MRELGTVIASLKLWQRTTDRSPVLVDIASGGGAFDPLDNEEVETLTATLGEITHPCPEPIEEAQDVLDFVRHVAELHRVKPYSSPVGKGEDPLSAAEECLNDLIERARKVYDAL